MSQPKSTLYQVNFWHVWKSISQSQFQSKKAEEATLLNNFGLLYSPSTTILVKIPFLCSLLNYTFLWSSFFWVFFYIYTMDNAMLYMCYIWDNAFFCFVYFVLINNKRLISNQRFSAFIDRRALYISFARTQLLPTHIFLCQFCKELCMINKCFDETK